MGKIYFPGLISTGFQSITLSNSTAIGINSTLRAASTNVLFISVETNNARFRGDGTDPALTTGVLLLTTNSPYIMEGYNQTTDWMFQRSTGVCKLQIQGYKYGKGIS